MKKKEQEIREHLRYLYGPSVGQKTWAKLANSLKEFRAARPVEQASSPDPNNPLTEADVILITYGDQFQDPGHPPLETLKNFLETYLLQAVSAVHILPFYPSTSDDGFSVSDYQAVDSWARQLGRYHPARGAVSADV